jgi:gas vesicle protein
MTDWRETKRMHDEARRVEREAVDFLQKQQYLDEKRRRDEAERVAIETETRETIAELRAEIKTLREKNEKITDVVGDVFLEIERMNDKLQTAIKQKTETMNDNLQAAIKQIGQRVDRDLNEIREEIRAEIKRGRGGKVFDLPPTLSRYGAN